MKIEGRDDIHPRPLSAVARVTLERGPCLN